MTDTILCPKFLRDFKDYKPHEEWLMLGAYALANNVTDIEDAVSYSPFTWLEKDIFRELTPHLAVYQCDIAKFLNSEYGVAPAKAEYAERRIFKIYRAMLDYYTAVMNTVEKFHAFGFFDTYPFIIPTSASKFAQIVFDDRTANVIAFVESAVIDFHVKYGLKLPPYKANQPVLNLTEEEARAEVLVKLLQFWHRSPHNLWVNKDEDPRHFENETNQICDQGHNFWITKSDGSIECGSCKYADSWEGMYI